MSISRRQEQPVSREELAQLLPAPTQPALPPDRHQLLKEHVMQEIGIESKPTPRATKTKRFTWIALPAGVAALAVAAVAMLGTQTDGGGYSPTNRVVVQPDNSSQAAGPLVQRLANTAANQPVLEIRDDQYIYVESKITEVEGAGDSPDNKEKKYSFRTNGHRESWHPVSGLKPGRDAQLKLDGHRVPLPAVATKESDAAKITSYRELEQLPTDPDKLYMKLKEDLNHKYREADPKWLDEELFNHILMMINETITPPKTAAALYRTAAKVPGVVEVPNAVDGLGRPGMGLAYDKGGMRSMWVFDKNDSTFLGAVSVIIARGEQTNYLMDGGVKVGTVTWSQAVVKRMVVDHLGDTNGQVITGKR